MLKPVRLLEITEFLRRLASRGREFGVWLAKVWERLADWPHRPRITRFVLGIGFLVLVILAIWSLIYLPQWQVDQLPEVGLQDDPGHIGNTFLFFLSRAGATRLVLVKKSDSETARSNWTPSVERGVGLDKIDAPAATLGFVLSKVAFGC
jgi:hypothetical protein